MAGVCVACALGAAQAREPGKAISQYVRDQWSRESGFPAGQVYAIAQTADGYLWVGTEKGLVRFDGLTFKLIQPPNSQGGATSSVLGLTTDAAGNLWVRLEGARLLRYHDGTFEDMSRSFERPESAITAMCRGQRGEALFSGFMNGIFKYQVGSFARLAGLPAPPDFLVISMAETSDGDVWLGTRDTGLFRVNGGQIYPGPAALRDRKINCLLSSGNELLIGTDDGLARWHGNEFLATAWPPSLKHAQILSMIKDRESNTWIGTADALVRIGPAGDFSVEKTGSRQAGGVTAIFQDRERNLWAGSPNGLERLRKAAFTTYSVAEGLPSDRVGPVYADSEGRIWFAPLEGGLYWIGDGEVHSVKTAGLDKDVIYSITGADSDLWLGRQTGGLTHLHYTGDSVESETYTQAQGLAQNNIYAVRETSDGAVWAGTLSAGLSRYEDGRFTTYTKGDGLASNTITSIAEAPDGTIWLGTPSGLSAFLRGQWRTYTSKDGLPEGTVNCLLLDRVGVLWVGTANGLAVIRSAQVQAFVKAPDWLREAILGIVEDKAGWLWIATANHVLRVERDDLLRQSLSPEEVREYDIADGLRSTEGVQRERSIARDTMGRIWLSTNHGLSFVDPARIDGRSSPAIVHIDGISADGREMNLRNPVRVPPPHRRVTIGYAGLSLAVPARVRFKFKLDGFDHDWSEPTASREAVYTNLSPGSYHFHLIASNSDGLWNSSESVLQFQIEPVFWQTWWFRLGCAFVLSVAVLAFLRLRTLRLTQQLNMRFEERLAERTRIAQELHDTLLQGFLSASMQLQVADDQLEPDSRAKPLVGRVIELMRDVSAESRNAVAGLRSDQNRSLDLGEAFSKVQQEFTDREKLTFRVVAEGATRPLHPIIRDEIYRIGREALINAFRHAHATRIEVELEYAPDRLRVLVRDDGTGISHQGVHTGRGGHWGLVGMRERAKKIGASLRVLSRPAAGTEVELSVPGHIAFASRPSSRPPSWSFHLLGWLNRNRHLPN